MGAAPRLAARDRLHHRRSSCVVPRRPPSAACAPVRRDRRCSRRVGLACCSSWCRPPTRTPVSAAGGCASSAWLLVAVVPASWCSCWCAARGAALLRGIREDEDAIRSLGKNVFAIKMQALIIGGLFGALGGMVYVLPASVQPDSMGRSLTFFCYTALLLGGAATIFGPVLGRDPLLRRPRIMIKGVANAYVPDQHHERPADRAVLLHRRRRRPDAARDLPTARHPRQQEGAAVQCLTPRMSHGRPGRPGRPAGR